MHMHPMVHDVDVRVHVIVVAHMSMHVCNVLYHTCGFARVRRVRLLMRSHV